MDFQVKDMEIQEFGDVAIATFHLEDRARISQSTNDRAA